ncbi:hypothetical protein [Streptomyces roseicoloratus]|uniref:LigA protein n=1 Tax=Streptomyces roseicoloratus TaxID=2508722 RepID=A0ABY9RW43_9ACTN|nr:hypothetical protein [Streptomyces roseicoloratus]WMX46391.1 hypothetical protein RGF97_18230 [Streptomyces roseicoloratus]
MSQHGEHDQTNGWFEEELGAVLRRTGEGFSVDDRRELVDGGLVRGRRRLLRRRVATVGGALALAGIGVGGVYGGSVLGAPGATEQASVAGPAPTARPQDTGMAEIPVADLAAVLKAATPAGAWQIDGLGGVGQSVLGVYDDGKGKAAVSVGLYRAGTTRESGIGQVTCPDRTAVPYDACTSERLPGGDRLMVLQGYEYPDKREETKNWRAVLLTKDGFLVDASEYNAPSEKGSAITREDPPFDPAQLKALVTAEGWRPLLRQIPVLEPVKTRPGASHGTSAPQHGPDVGETLRSLLPSGKGLKVVEKSGDSTGGYVVVDDGTGKSLIGINVQPDMNRVRDDLFGSGEVTTLPDGTVVKLEKRPGEKGGAGVVWWSADTMSQDGFRVVVSAFNSGAQHESATRAEPALTTEELKTIALSPKWRERATR